MMTTTTSSPDWWAQRLVAAGYHARRPECLALAWATTPGGGSGARALLLEGPPGVGKSALAEAVARVLHAQLVVYQAHAWTDADELFVGVDVVAAVAGEAAAVRQPGVLAQVAEASHRGQVVLLLDELDKTEERAEALLLDWLQSGRVPLQPGRHVLSNLENVLVFITSNGMRQLSDALLRRVRRVQVKPLPVDVVDRLLAERTGCPQHIAGMVSKLARHVSEAQGAPVSLQELVHCVAELRHAATASDAVETCRGWMARSEVGRQAVTRETVSPLWGEILKIRRAGGKI